MIRSLILALLLSSPAQAQLVPVSNVELCDVRFDWSPVAEHHQAAVQVQAGSIGGSGTYIEHDGVRLVVTCQHVAAGGSAATIRFQDGRTFRGPTVTDKFGHDLAAVVIDDAGPTPVSLAEQEPSSRIEIMGFGGPAKKLRHWFGRIAVVSGDRVHYDCGVAAGDSGGGVLNERHELVGVITAGTTPNSPTEGWRTHERSTGPYWTPVRNFIGRVVEGIRTQQFCPPGGCPPRGQPYGGPPRGRGQLYPPDQQPRQQPPQQPEQPPPQYAKEFDSIRESLGEIKQSVQEIDIRVIALESVGPAGGGGGKDGRDGRDADPQAVAQLVINAIKQDSELRAMLRGPPGRDGRDGAAGQSPQLSAERKFIVIGEPEASYASRLSREVENTKQYFDAIELYPPPEEKNVGTLPALVLYVGGKRAVTYRGTSDVYRYLSRIRRGEFTN